MEIQYLNSLQNYPIIKGYKNEGIPEAEIAQAELQLGIQFPKAYKEFLFLAGKLNNGLFGNAIEDNLDWAIKDFQQDAKEELARKNITISKPYWVFASKDGCEQFYFFYLNVSDPPPIYVWSGFISKEKSEEDLPKGVRKISDTFSSRIDELIKHHKNGNM